MGQLLKENKKQLFICSRKSLSYVITWPREGYNPKPQLFRFPSMQYTYNTHTSCSPCAPSMTTFASIGGLLMVGVHDLGAVSDKVSRSVGEVLPEPGALFATKLPSGVSYELRSTRRDVLSMLTLLRLSPPLYTFPLWIGLFTITSPSVEEYFGNPDVTTPGKGGLLYLRDMIFTASGFRSCSRNLPDTTNTSGH